MISHEFFGYGRLLAAENHPWYESVPRAPIEQKENVGTVSRQEQRWKRYL